MKLKLKLFIFLFAIFVLQNVLFAQSEDAGVSFVFAKKLYNDGMYDLAAEQFHQFAEQNPNHAKAPEAMLMAGKSYLKTGDFNNAKKEFVYLISRFPDAKNLDEAQFSIAECFENNNEFSAAAKAYHQVKIFHHKSSLATKSLLMSALMYKKVKEYETVIEVLYELLEFYPTCKEYNQSRLLLAKNYKDMGKYNHAQIELEKILGSTKTGNINAQAMLENARIENLSERIQQAEIYYEHLIKKYRSAAKRNEQILEVLDNAYYEIAELLNKKGMYEKSNGYLEKVSNCEINNRCLLRKADNYFALKQYNNANYLYKQITTNPKDSSYLAESFFKSGYCYSELKDFSNSIDAYAQVINIYQSSKNKDYQELCTQSYQKISENYINLNQPQIAIKYLREYLHKTDTDKYSDIIEFKIARLYEKEVADIERAIRGYYDFLDNHPRSKLIDDAQLYLARCYEKKKSYSQAIIEYKNLINRYPASEHFNFAIKRIEYISNYHLIGEDVLSKFSKLIQQITVSQSEAFSAFNIGLIQFKELKDYRSAITMFKNSYKNKPEKKINSDELIYYLGRAYQLLGEKNNIEKESAKANLDSADYYYKILIETFPQSNWADGAAFYQIKITFNNQMNFQKQKDVLTAFKYNFTESKLIDKINFKLGKLLLEQGIKSSIDSLDVHNCFDNIIKSFPGSPLIPQAEFYLAILFYKNGNINEAENKLKFYIDNFNNDQHICEAYSLLAQISESKGDYLHAEKYLKHIVTNYFYSICSDNAQLKIGKLLLKQNKFSEASDYFQNLYIENINAKNNMFNNSSLNDKTVIQKIVFNKATISLRNGDKIEAYRLFNQYLKLSPQGEYADKVLFSLGELFFTNRGEEQKKAISYFKQLVNDFPSSCLIDNAMVKLGDLFYQKKEYVTANEYYSNVLQNDEKDIDNSYPYSQKIIGMYRQGKINQADQQFKIFKKRYKAEKSLIANVMLEKGNYFLKQKNFKLAEKIFKDARSEFKNTPDGARAEYLLAKLYFILNKDEEALEIITKLIKRYPGDKILPDVYITLGNFYYLQAKQIQNAMLAYKSAIEQENIEEEKLKLGMNNLIKCYSDLRLREQALFLINKYLKSFPTADDIFDKKVEMAIIYYKLNEYDRALQLLRKLRREADIENEPRIQYWIGECYFGKGDFKRAVNEYLKVVYLSKPTKLNWRVTAQYQAGVACIKAGEHNKAKDIFNKILIEQGAESVFGKPAKKKIKEIEQLLAVKSGKNKTN